MRVTKPLTEQWIESFNRIFEFHPDKEQIMDKFLGDELISRSQINKWFHEATEAAELALQAQLQEMMEA